MNLHVAIDLAIILLAVVISSVVTLYIAKKGIQVFESSIDRDGTILLFLLFVALFYTQALFAEKVTGEMVANLTGNITGGILTACAFVYKQRQNGKG